MSVKESLWLAGLTRGPLMIQRAPVQRAAACLVPAELLIEPPTHAQFTPQGTTSARTLALRAAGSGMRCQRVARWCSSAPPPSARPFCWRLSMAQMSVVVTAALATTSAAGPGSAVLAHRPWPYSQAYVRAPVGWLALPNAVSAGGWPQIHAFPGGDASPARHNTPL